MGVSVTAWQQVRLAVICNTGVRCKPFPRCQDCSPGEEGWFDVPQSVRDATNAMSEKNGLQIRGLLLDERSSRLSQGGPKDPCFGLRLSIRSLMLAGRWSESICFRHGTWFFALIPSARHCDCPLAVVAVYRHEVSESISMRRNRVRASG